MKHLTVLVVAGHLDPDDLGGAETHMVEVIAGLAERGHTLHVFVGNDASSASIFSHSNIHVHTVSYKEIPNLNSVLYIRSAVSAIKQFISETPVDVIHAKQVFPQGVIGALLKKAFPKIPYYLTAQNPLAYYEELVLNVPLLPRSLQHSFQHLLKPFAKFALKYADVTAAVSTYSENASTKLGAKDTCIVPNGVHVKRFSPEDNRPKDHFVITTTSTLIPRNGVDILLEGFRLFHEHHPNSVLEIAGAGPLQSELEEFVAQHNLGSAVTFLGTLPHHEVPALLNRSHVFVRPSRFEGFGMSFVEAMACKIPVVTCPVGGIVDFVTDRKTGMLVPVEDPQAVCDALVELHDNPALRDSIVEQAYDMVCSTYDWQSIVDRVENAYRELLSKGA